MKNKTVLIISLIFFLNSCGLFGVADRELFQGAWRSDISIDSNNWCGYSWWNYCSVYSKVYLGYDFQPDSSALIDLFDPDNEVKGYYRIKTITENTSINWWGANQIITGVTVLEEGTFLAKALDEEITLYPYNNYQNFGLYSRTLNYDFINRNEDNTRISLRDTSDFFNNEQTFTRIYKY